MTAYFDSSFEGGIHRLDGNTYERCTFLNCRLDYGAVAPFTVSECTFDGCQWIFVEHAALTIDLLRQFYASPQSRSVAQDFVDMIQGKQPEGVRAPSASPDSGRRAAAPPRSGRRTSKRG